MLCYTTFIQHEHLNSQQGIILGNKVSVLLRTNFLLDVNECELDLAECPDNAFCTNNEGGFECICNIGFEGNGTSCISE